MTGRVLVAAIAAPIAVFLTLIGGFAMLFGGGGAAACTVPAAGIPPAASPGTSTANPAPGLNAPSYPLTLPLQPPATTATSTSPASPASFPTADVPGFDEDQVANAAVIITTGAELGVPIRGWIIAVAAAIQESGLRNLGHGDTSGPDSLGLFQQRTGWGRRAARLDPEQASHMFYLGGTAGQPGLLDIPGWQTMPLTQAAQAVQQSAHPNAYAAHEAAATTLVAALTGIGTNAGSLPGFGAATSCAEPGSPAAAQAVAYARQQIGVPYQWGGDGPTDGGFDCSGLTTAAYAAAGIDLPRTAQAQYDAGPPLSPADDLQPGDLVFFGSSTQHVTHVGIYVGDDQMIDAPYTGATVRTEDYHWSDYLGATRPTL